MQIMLVVKKVRKAVSSAGVKPESGFQPSKNNESRLQTSVMMQLN